MLVARWAMEQEIDHLHAHFASVAGRTARLAAGLVGLTWSVTAHAKDIFHEDNDPRRQAQVLGGADRVVGVSDMTADWISSLVPGANVTRIYNGLDLDDLTWQAPAALPTGRIVGVGRLVAKKGWPDFLSAIALLREAGHNVTGDIAGTGVLEEQLRAQADSLGIADVVTFHGPMPQHEVAQLVRSATVFAAPCVVQGVRVPRRGPADGDRGGRRPAHPRASERGVAHPPGDVEALTDALRALVSDGDLRARFGAAARAAAVDRFSWQAVVDRVLAAACAPSPALRSTTEVAV